VPVGSAMRAYGSWIASPLIRIWFALRKLGPHTIRRSFGNKNQTAAAVATVIQRFSLS